MAGLVSDELKKASDGFWRELHQIPAVTDEWLNKHVMRIGSVLLYEKGYEDGFRDAFVPELTSKLTDQLGDLSNVVKKQIGKLSLEQLKKLSDDSLQFKIRSELKQWLKQNAQVK